MAPRLESIATNCWRRSFHTEGPAMAKARCWVMADVARELGRMQMDLSLDAESMKSDRCFLFSAL